MNKYVYKDEDQIIYYLSDSEVKDYDDLIEKVWYRLDGPARLFYNGYEEYWINDQHIEKELYWTHPVVIKYNIFGIE